MVRFSNKVFICFYFLSLLSLLTSSSSPDVANILEDKLNKLIEAKMLKFQSQLDDLMQHKEKSTTVIAQFKIQIQQMNTDIEQLNFKNEKLQLEVNELRARSIPNEPEIIIANEPQEVRTQQPITNMERNGDDLLLNSSSRAISMPTSCSDLAIIGSIKPNSGFYTVKASDSQLRTVFCDFTQAIGSAGYETRMGYNAIKTSSFAIYKNAFRTSSYSAVGTVIPYTDGGATYPPSLIVPSGISTAPVSGTYLYTFNSIADVANTIVDIRWKGTPSSMAYAFSAGDTISISATLPLSEGDIVDVFLRQGAIRAYPGDLSDFPYVTKFTGILLEERVSENLP